MKKILMGGIVSFSLLMLGNIGFAAEWNLPGITIITRSQRGADESIRFLSKSKAELAAERNAKEQERLANLKQTNPTAYQAELKKIEAAQKTAEQNAKISAERNAYMSKNYPNDRTLDYTNDKMGDFYLLYQDQIKNNKTKLIVHHTAMTYDTNRTEAEIKASLQNIYKYHTIDRDFGDIGYNFLIDHLGNIYEGRAGGEGAVGMHVAYNNISSVGISLMGNFEETPPTQAQLNTLTDLLTALARHYNIDPTAKETYHQLSSSYPYMTHKELYTIVGHGDIAATACPGKYMKELLPLIRGEVSRRLQEGGTKEVSLKGEIPTETNPPKTSSPSQSPNTALTTSSDFGTKLMNIKQQNAELLQAVVNLVRERYKAPLPNATNTSDKLTYKYSLEEAKKLVNKDISVLLYELTTEYDNFDITCETLCQVIIDNGEGKEETYERPSMTVLFDKQANITIAKDATSTTFPADKIVITSQDELVTITNYDRKSYVGIPRNTFRGSLTFEVSDYITTQGEAKHAPVVINTLPFMDYMNGIVETNDTEHLEKNKVMAMIAKNYALFYLEKKNLHPSVPENATFSAIDSPEMFQKYAGAGVEKTLTKRYQALEATKNQVVMYNGTLPILPYFSCSAGFTLSAQEKRGWTDAPYLQSVYDFSSCSEFQGHGVGLAGKGAEFFAQKGMNYQDILKRYYDGIQIITR